MTDDADNEQAVKKRAWSLSRIACGLLAAGYPVLLIEVYQDHRLVVQSEAIAWAPIVTAAVAGLCLAVAVARWRGGRLVGAVGGGLSLLVGLVGLVLHNLERFSGDLPFAALLPPLLAPLAFTGLGVFGLLFTLWPGDEA